MFFLFSTSLQPWAVCWFTHTGSEAQRPLEMVPSTPPFFSPHCFSALCCLLCATAGSVSTLGLTKDLPLYSFLIPNKTWVCRDLILWHREGNAPLCQDTNSYNDVKMYIMSVSVSVLCYVYIVIKQPMAHTLRYLSVRTFHGKFLTLMLTC